MAKQEALVEAPPQAVARPINESPLAMFERMASDPAVDVDKFERLMQMREREMARVAREHFNAAMAKAQSEMRRVAADANNQQTRSKYASYAAIDRELRPIYSANGFAPSFDTGESALPEHIRVLCHLSHAGGHSHTYHVDMPADGKGAKGGDVMTRTHAVGAAMSYGMRYLLKMIFNVAVGEDDTDGNQPQQRPHPPAGFGAWLTDLTATADNGIAALQLAWNASKQEYRDYMAKYGAEKLAELKKKAKAVKA